MSILKTLRIKHVGDFVNFEPSIQNYDAKNGTEEIRENDNSEIEFNQIIQNAIKNNIKSDDKDTDVDMINDTNDEENCNNKNGNNEKSVIKPLGYKRKSCTDSSSVIAKKLKDEKNPIRLIKEKFAKLLFEKRFLFQDKTSNPGFNYFILNYENSDMEILLALMNMVENSSWISSLIFEDYDISTMKEDDKEIHCLIMECIIIHAKSLRHINITESTIPENLIKKIFSHLYHNSNLRHIGFRFDTIESTTDDISELIKVNNNIQSVHIVCGSNGYARYLDMKQLSDSMSLSRELLSFEMVDFCDSFTNVKNLYFPKQMRELKLNSFYISDIIDNIIQFIEKSNALVSLSFSDNIFDDHCDKTESILKAIANSSTLKILDISRFSQHPINQQCILSLFLNTNLEYINLSDNDIQDESVDSITNYLKSEIKLISLNLKQNKFRDFGLSKIISSLERNTSLKEISLSVFPENSYAFFQDRKLSKLEFASMLEKNSFLKIFELNAQINQDDIKYFLEKGKNCFSLEECSFIFSEKSTISKMNNNTSETSVTNKIRNQHDEILMNGKIYNVCFFLWNVFLDLNSNWNLPFETRDFVKVITRIKFCNSSFDFENESFFEREFLNLCQLKRNGEEYIRLPRQNQQDTISNQRRQETFAAWSLAHIFPKDLVKIIMRPRKDTSWFFHPESEKLVYYPNAECIIKHSK